MGFLSDEELSRLSPAAQSLYPSPIPVQSVSSDEFMPPPQTAKQREFECGHRHRLEGEQRCNFAIDRAREFARTDGASCCGLVDFP